MIWTYPACVMVGHHDGDTIYVDIDLGQQMWVRRRSVRLVGVACNELKDPGGPEASAAVNTKVPVGTPLGLISRGWDKYAGRIDALVYLDVPQSLTLQSWLVLEGWAVPWSGKGAQPKVPFPPVVGEAKVW